MTKSSNQRFLNWRRLDLPKLPISSSICFTNHIQAQVCKHRFPVSPILFLLLSQRNFRQRIQRLRHLHSSELLLSNPDRRIIVESIDILIIQIDLPHWITIVIMHIVEYVNLRVVVCKPEVQNLTIWFLDDIHQLWLLCMLEQVQFCGIIVRDEADTIVEAYVLGSEVVDCCLGVEVDGPILHVLAAVVVECVVLDGFV